MKCTCIQYIQQDGAVHAARMQIQRRPATFSIFIIYLEFWTGRNRTSSSRRWLLGPLDAEIKVTFIFEVAGVEHLVFAVFNVCDTKIIALDNLGFVEVLVMRKPGVHRGYVLNPLYEQGLLSIA